ncbi:Uncharacterised protein [uncultured archaeon]|nr:Uncharacterised protein [uncultured archaeon]
MKNIFSNRTVFLFFEEAHAISEWNHGFLPGYSNVVRWIRGNCAIREFKPSLNALTSINIRLVLLDIMNELDLGDPGCIVESASYDRRNLHYEIHKVNAKNRMPVLISLIKSTLREYGWQGNSPKIPCGLIICADEDDEDFGLIGLSKSLGSYLNMPVGVCSCKPPKKFSRLGGSREEWTGKSHEALLQFKRNELPILVCSRDMANELSKKDIRFTLHTDRPASLYEFYLQSGRAGHDGMKSSCIMLSSDGDELSGNCIADSRNGGSRIRELSCEGFPGKVIEKRILCWVILKLLMSSPGHNIGDRVDFEIFIPSTPLPAKEGIGLPMECRQELLEKALYRLLLLGAIDGYERKTGSFKVTAKIREASHIYCSYEKYIERYETESQAAHYIPSGNSSTYKNTAMKCGCRLIDYIYQKAKIKKDADLAVMNEATGAGQPVLRNFRDSLHDLLERSIIEARLTLAESESWWSILDGINGLDDLLELHLTCQRKIKSEPDNFALRMITGFCAFAFPDRERKSNDFEEGLCSLLDSTTEAYRADICRHIFSYAEFLMPSQRDVILKIIWQTDPSLEISRFCYEKSDFSSEICYSSIFKLVNGLLAINKAKGVVL